MPPVPEDRERPKVLVVDDEHSIANTLRAILNQSGFEAAVAYNGQAAIDTARIWKPDILLSDVVMPEVNGIETAIRIQAIHSDCRVLLFSGNINVGDLIQDARERGYEFEILAKPIAPAELLARLRSILA